MARSHDVALAGTQSFYGSPACAVRNSQADVLTLKNRCLYLIHRSVSTITFSPKQFSFPGRHHMLAVVTKGEQRSPDADDG